MLSLIAFRALLVALPFGIYFAWREVARRRGQPMGVTPWTWLLAAGLVLAGLSLMGTVLFEEDNRGSTYVPAQAEPGGRVRPGGFDDSRARPTPNETAPNTAP